MCQIRLEHPKTPRNQSKDKNWSCFIVTSYDPLWPWHMAGHSKSIRRRWFILPHPYYILQHTPESKETRPDTSWLDMAGGYNFQVMCQIEQWEVKNFCCDPPFFCELFTKKKTWRYVHPPPPPPYKCEGWDVQIFQGYDYNHIHAWVSCPLIPVVIFNY